MPRVAVAEKRYLFELSADESSEGKRVKFAATIPSVRKSGDDFRDDDLNLKRESFIRLMDCAWRNPEVILQTESWMVRRVECMRVRVDPGFFEKVTTLGALDEPWVCSYICQKLGIKLQFLERVCDEDPEVWLHMLEFLLVAAMSLKLADSNREKRVMSVTLDTRAAAAGDRTFKDNSEQAMVIAGKNMFNWALFGVYMIKWGEHKAESIVHRPTSTEVKIPDHVVITKKFELSSNWSDFSATIALKPTVYNIASDFFSPSTGPHRCPQITSQAWQTLSSKSKGYVAAEKLIAGCREQAPAPTAFNADRKAQTKKAALIKAREALKQQKESLTRKRSIKFD